jgi:hypothetical protein
VPWRRPGGSTTISALTSIAWMLLLAAGLRRYYAALRPPDSSQAIVTPEPVPALGDADTLRLGPASMTAAYVKTAALPREDDASAGDALPPTTRRVPRSAVLGAPLGNLTTRRGAS